MITVLLVQSTTLQLTGLLEENDCLIYTRANTLVELQTPFILAYVTQLYDDKKVWWKDQLQQTKNVNKVDTQINLVFEVFYEIARSILFQRQAYQV